jgi:hypothetical protein
MIKQNTGGKLINTASIADRLGFDKVAHILGVEICGGITHPICCS